MKANEVITVMDKLALHYPQLRNRSDKDKAMDIAAWAADFRDDSLDIVTAAIDAFRRAGGSNGFPPNADQIRAQINAMENARNDRLPGPYTRAGFCWAHICNAVRMVKSGEDANTAYTRLSTYPRMVTDTAEIAAWARLDDGAIGEAVRTATQPRVFALCDSGRIPTKRKARQLETSRMPVLEEGEWRLEH